jgi:hypothetical protein
MMTTTAIATLLPGGLEAITNAITSGNEITISKWELGAAANEVVPSGTTSAIPNAIYTGNASRVLLEQENGLAVFNIVLDDTIGDFYVGNLALKIIDPVLEDERLLAVVMFPETIYKTKNEALGGAPGETGRYYVVKLVIHLQTMAAVANITVGNTHFTAIPSVDNINSLVDPGASSYSHQILLQTPDTGAPSLLVARAGDNQWWGFAFSWPVDAHNFGVISGGYQGDWYAADNIEVVFGGFFHFDSSDFDEVIDGGSNWESGNNTNLVNGGTWSL